MRNIMLDIETLDTAHSAVVLSIGAVKFNDFEVGGKFYETIDLKDQALHGRTMSVDTISWWMGQSDAARQAVLKTGLPGNEVLKKLALFMSDKEYKVWGNGAMFDNVIILDMYKAYGIGRPWSYKNDRCYRTVLAEHTSRNPRFTNVKYGTAHNALDDAISQAFTLQKIWLGGVD